MKIYVAGPYTTGNTITNVRRAILAGEKLRQLGHTPYIPHMNMLWELLSPQSYDFWLELDMEWLAECDAVLRLSGESPGADLEEAFCKGRGIPVYHHVRDIPDAPV